MPKYYYKAKDRRGVAVYGEIEAPNLWKAKKTLNESHLLILELKKFNLKGFYQALNYRFEFQTANIPPEEVEVLLGQIEAGHSVGMPITQILEFAHNEQKNKFLKTVIFNISEDIKQGKSLHEAFSKHPKIFTPTIIGLLKVGESSGRIYETLTEINRVMVQQNENRQRYKAAVFYPKFVFGYTAVIFLFINYLIVPIVKKTLLQQNINPPFLTRMVIGTSDAFLRYWFIILPLIVGLFFTFRNYSKSPEGMAKIDPLLLKIPKVGDILKFLDLYQFCLVLNLQLKSGLSMMESLENIKDSLSNYAFKDAMTGCQSDILQGGTLTQGLEKSGLFPSSFNAMISISEETGRLQHALEKLTNQYQNEIKYRIEKLSKLIEPTMLLITSGFIVVLMLAILLPINELKKAEIRNRPDMKIIQDIRDSTVGPTK
jgi:MSHA biogenesis protein MshG